MAALSKPAPITKWGAGVARAKAREAEKAKVLAAFYVDTPTPGDEGRQVERRRLRRTAKSAGASVRRNRIAAELKARRAEYPPAKAARVTPKRRGGALKHLNSHARRIAEAR